jgi:chromosome segregation ATPase
MTLNAQSRFDLVRKGSMKSKIVSLTKREAELVGEVSVLRTELEKIRNEENKLLVNKAAVVESQAQEITRLESLLNQTTEELRMIRENSRIKIDHDGVFNAEMSILKKQVNEKNKKIEEMKEDVKAKTTEIDNLKKRCNLESRKLEASMVEVSAQTVGISHENQKLKDLLARTRKSHEETENKLFELQADYMLQGSQLKSLKERLEGEKSQSSLENQLEDAHSKNSELRFKIIEIEKDRLALKERIEQKDTGSADWEKRLLEKERALNTNLQIIDELEKRINHYEKKERAGDNPTKQVDHLRTLLAHKVEDVKVLEDQNQKLKSQNENLQDKLEQLKQKVTLIHEEVRLSKQQVNSSLGNDTGKLDWLPKSTQSPDFGMETKVNLNIGEHELSGEENVDNLAAKYGFSDANLTSSFNRAMARLRNEDLQAGRSVSDSESQASTFGDQREQKKLRAPALQETVKITDHGLDHKLRGLEELVRVLERENLLLVRKFESSRREISALNDNIDELTRKLRDCHVKNEELLGEIQGWKAKVDEKDRHITSLDQEKVVVTKEKDVYLTRLRQEEEMGPGVSRDQEWHEALKRINKESQKKDKDIDQLSEEIGNLKYLIGKLQAENSRVPDLENETIVLRAQLAKADERLFAAERESKSVHEQLKRLAKHQIRSEDEDWAMSENARREAEERAVAKGDQTSLEKKCKRLAAENESLRVDLAVAEDLSQRAGFKTEQLEAAVDQLELDRERADLAVRQLEGIVEHLKVVSPHPGPARRPPRPAGPLILTSVLAQLINLKPRSNPATWAVMAANVAPDASEVPRPVPARCCWYLFVTG